MATQENWWEGSAIVAKPSKAQQVDGGIYVPPTKTPEQIADEARKAEEFGMKKRGEVREEEKFGRQMQDLTEGQSKAVDFYQRGRSSQIELERLNLNPDDLIALATQEVLPSNLANRFSDTDRRLYRAAAKNFAMATLRRESGAQIAPDEIANQISIFFPGAGADEREKQVLKRQRDLTILGLGSAAGPYGLEQANKNLQSLGFIDEQGNAIIPPAAGAAETPVAGLAAARPGDRVVAEQDLKNARELQAAWQSGKSIEELNAISLRNVGSALTPETIQALQGDTKRQLQFKPYLAPMEDVTEDMGIVEGAIESLTGSERSTPEIEATADWTTMPELNELSVAGARTGIGTMFTSPEESVQIIQANYPGVQVRQDEKGNYILRSQDGKDYGIKPGFRWSDVPRAVGGILAFTPAGRAATFTGAAVKSGATQAGIEATEFAAGGEFNAQPILMATAAGPAEKIVGDVLSTALPAVTSKIKQLTGRPEVPLGAAPEAPSGMAMPPAATMAPEAPIPGATVSPAPTVTAPASRPAGGAMSTSEEAIRVQRAAELPVPIELARFQRTRDFVEQQRARELAKNNEVGGPIRDRMARQQDELRQNFERFIEGTGSEVWNNPYEQGGVIADALGTLAKRERTRTNALYKRAEKAGEMREPVDYTELSDFIAQQTPTTREKLAPVLKTVEEQLLANDPNKTGMISLNLMEDIRKLINKVASPGTPDASFGRDMRGIIDNATKDAGGDVYKQARASRAKYARDFEDIDLIQKVFDTKPGSTERYVGLEKVTDKITGEGTPLDSVKHLIGLLEKAGPRGTRAMRELQGSVMEKIRDQAYRGVTTDESGQVVIQPAALNKIITSMNKNGKLDLIFDKKTAELLNTINDVTKDIITSPPGSVNASGTSSAMMNAIYTLGTFSATGLPVPAAKILNDFRKAMAARGMRKEVKRLLD